MDPLDIDNLLTTFRIRSHKEDSSGVRKHRFKLGILEDMGILLEILINVLCEIGNLFN